MIRLGLSGTAIAALLLLALASTPIHSVRPALAISCDDFLVQQLAQQLLKANPSDPNHLDGTDHNGIACDSLPCPCDLTPVPSAALEPSPTATRTPLPTDVSQAPTAVIQALFTPTAIPPTPTQPVTISLAPTATPVVSATVVSAQDSQTQVINQITPPSTGDGGLIGSQP